LLDHSAATKSSFEKTLETGTGPFLFRFAGQRKVVPSYFSGSANVANSKDLKVAAHLALMGIDAPGLFTGMGEAEAGA
jgi:hypothetical protein